MLAWGKCLPGIVGLGSDSRGSPCPVLLQRPVYPDNSKLPCGLSVTRRPQVVTRAVLPGSDKSRCRIYRWPIVPLPWNLPSQMSLTVKFLLMVSGWQAMLWNEEHTPAFCSDCPGILMWLQAKSPLLSWSQSLHLPGECWVGDIVIWHRPSAVDNEQRPRVPHLGCERLVLSWHRSFKSGWREDFVFRKQLEVLKIRLLRQITESPPQTLGECSPLCPGEQGTKRDEILRPNQIFIPRCHSAFEKSGCPSVLISALEIVWG